MALLVLSLYVVIPAILASSAPRRTAPQLPRTVSGLLSVIGMETALFGAWFGLGWLLARTSREELRLGGKLGWGSFVAGLGQAAAIWVGLAISLSAIAAFAASVLHVSPETLAALRPRVENVVDPSILRANRVYLGLLLTVVSFGLGGLREELWRAAMLGVARSLWPVAARSRRAEACIVVAVAVLFGVGHWAQGPGGIIATGMLGVAFGAVLVQRGSLWEAALAHGFFDAVNFGLLALGWG